MRLTALALLSTAFLWTGCSSLQRQPAPVSQASHELKLARSTRLPVSARAAAYLEAASLACSSLENPKREPKARSIYNSATAELADLLQEHPPLWNRRLTLQAPSGPYRLEFKPANEKGAWAPTHFTELVPASRVKTRSLRKHIRVEGLGGALVGIHKSEDAPGNFELRHGKVAPVTATLDFKGRSATLALWDPAVRPTTRVNGAVRPLAADFSAPIAGLPRRNELWNGLMAMVEVDKYLQNTGLYMLGPYAPDRIPVILVHGLMSTPQMWFNVVNELQGDPELRGRFQFWVFRYPTGNPVTYSALRFREELARVQQMYPRCKGMILVGHSMGGLVSRMQATSTGRAIWDPAFKTHAEHYYRKLPPDNIIKQALIFDANPKVKRLVFICVPHRGSNLALSSIGALGMKLIRLPGTLVTTITESVGDALEIVGGKVDIPTSINGLSPKSTALIAMDKLPIQAPYHSIIGDRGKGNSPNSSDGIVPYWSSHLAGAQSELIVPGPHGSYERPESVAELKRILLLQVRR